MKDEFNSLTAAGGAAFDHRLGVRHAVLNTKVKRRSYFYLRATDAYPATANVFALEAQLELVSQPDAARPFAEEHACLATKIDVRCKSESQLID